MCGPDLSRSVERRMFGRGKVGHDGGSDVRGGVVAAIPPVYAPLLQVQRIVLTSEMTLPLVIRKR